MGPRNARVDVRKLTTSLALLLAAGGVIADSGNLNTADRDTWRRLQAGDPALATGTDLTADTTAAVAPAFRTYDGRGNNVRNPLWGSAGTTYRREDSGAAYANGTSAPAGATRPSPRVISNAIVDQGDLDTEDERDLATTIYEFGQFLDHDIGLAKGGSTEDFDIHVPMGDPYFDPDRRGDRVIFFDRSAFDPNTGTRSPRQQINTVTA